MRRSNRNILIVLTGVLALVILYAWYSYNRTVDLGDHIVSVIIKPGDSFTSVADILLSEGVVESKIMLMYPSRLLGIDRKLTPGRYDFIGRNSCRSVLAKLRRADFVKVRITIPEGLSIWKVASIVAGKLDLDSSVIVGLNRDSTFLKVVGLPCLEGYLFPETYVFPWGVSEIEVVQGMIRQFYAKTEGLWPDRIPAGLSRHEIVILASIIEAETKLERERSMVASVYFNRLRKNMKLQADPTVIYGLGGLDHPLSRRELQQDTPFNTYLHKGIPPTPINSPGLPAITAALHPEETDYLYFVADETGGHYFSRTYTEHNQAKRRIKRLKHTIN